MTRLRRERRSAEDEGVDGVAGESSRVVGEGRGVCFFGSDRARHEARGCAGALVDGGIRDIEWIAKQRFRSTPLRTPVQSMAVEGHRVAGPVEWPGATSARVKVRPGDFVLPTRTASS